MAVVSSTRKVVFPSIERKVQSPYLYLQSVGSTGADGSTYGAHVRWTLLRNLGETHLPKGNAARTSVKFNRVNDFVRLRRSRYVERFPTIVDFSIVPDRIHDEPGLWVYTKTNTATTVHVHFRDPATYATVRSSVDPGLEPQEFIRQYCPALIEVEMKDRLFFAAEFDVMHNDDTILRAEALSVEENEPLSPTVVSCRKKFTNSDWCSGEGDAAHSGGDESGDVVENSSASGTSSSTVNGNPVTDDPESDDAESGAELTVASDSSFSSILNDGGDSPIILDGGATGAPTPDPGVALSPLPECCGGPNLLGNGGFEQSIPDGDIETDYVLSNSGTPGTVAVTTNAAEINAGWRGGPHSGERFLAVAGGGDGYDAVVRFSKEIEQEKEYCFSGWLRTLRSLNEPVELEVRFSTDNNVVAVYTVLVMTSESPWQSFSIRWNSGGARAVVVQLLMRSRARAGNDIGIDDLHFCPAAPEAKECRPRLRSENIRSVRFDVTSGYPRGVELESYEDYITGAEWTDLSLHALSTDRNTVLGRLEANPGSVHGRWRKFNDGATLNRSNYIDRWDRAGGLKEGVERYITLSDTDPRATDTLQGDVQPDDGSVVVSMLDVLGLVSLDFHVARMLGLGYLDLTLNGDDDEVIYLAEYDTNGALDDTGVARSVRHYYMGVPTRPSDHRLPNIPVLKPASYGLPIDNGGVEPVHLTDAHGYTPDGVARYVNLVVEREEEVAGSGRFFVPDVEFCAIDRTAQIFYGVEYRAAGEPVWRKPEIAHDPSYMDAGSPSVNETLPLPNNDDPAIPILRHEEREEGVHEYAAYAINWFSRASAVGNIVVTDQTTLTKPNRLLPPSNLMAQIIQQESPLLLTTAHEQSMLEDLTGQDTTLVRVTFDYNHTHDINYDFADTVQVFFRSEMAENVVGAVKSVSDDPVDNTKARVHTKDYPVNSSGSIISPTLDHGKFSHFIGGSFNCRGESFIIADVVAPAAPDEGPVFTVRKNLTGTATDPDSSGSYVTVQEYRGPEPGNQPGDPAMFMAVENLSSADSWGSPNPISKAITIGDPSWTTHQETYLKDGVEVNTTLRGVVADAVVHDMGDGLYRVEFQSYELDHHPQYGEHDPVDWYKGVVRAPVAGDPAGPKKELEVLAIEKLGEGVPLVLHVLDNAYDPVDSDTHVVAGSTVTVNYYPGYRVYLYADTTTDFTESTLLPASGEGRRTTWLGVRSRDSLRNYHSAVGRPAPITAFEFLEPVAPGRPTGPEYASRPDFYYKSAYTFTMTFAPGHTPFSVAIYRTTEEAILRALYNSTSYAAVREQLALLGEGDPNRAARWRNLIGFDYSDNPAGRFREYDGYAFPNPDRGGALDGSPPGTITPAVKKAVLETFVPLTELPLIYEYIHDQTHVPTPGPQRLRDSRGDLLDPNDPEFDMAPMARRTGNGTEIQFTDFSLDGTGNNLLFYLGREIGNRGRIGDPGPIAGPVRLINSRPPDRPGIKRVYVREAGSANGDVPAVVVEVNEYPAEQNVRKMVLYRAADAADALSIRTMVQVATHEFNGGTGTNGIVLTDEFDGVNIPYGELLYYRVVAMRSITNAQGNADWAPSQPSKPLLTSVPDTAIPDAPELSYTSDGISGTPAVQTNVVLSWPATAYNATYHLEKYESPDIWRTIYSVKTNEAVDVGLAATTLDSDALPKENELTGSALVHRFRVRVENSAGIFSEGEDVLVI